MSKPRPGAPTLVPALLACLCGSCGGTSPVQRVVAAIQIVSGDGQTGVAGEQLPEPVVVRVTDSTGAPVEGQIINFVVTVGGGSVFAGVALSDADGTARELWTLGPAPGPQQLAARAVDTQTGQPIVFATFNALASAHPPAGSFSPTGDMNAARTYHTTTLLADGTVLVAGSASEATAERYDPASGSFTTTGPMGMPRTLHTASALLDGRVLVAGGGDASSTCELYEPTTDSFAPTGSMTTTRSGHTATVLDDGRVLVVAGSSYGVELYDPAAGSFALTGDTARWHAADHAAARLLDGTVLVCGGTDGGADADIYTPAAGSFASTGAMLGRRSGHTATTLPDGTVLITGGVHLLTYLASAEIYDPSTGTFSATGDMSVARRGHAAVLLADGSVLVAGGEDVATAEVYVPATRTFMPAGTMASTRAYFAATLLADGSVLVAGGQDRNWRSLSSAELWRATP